MSEERTREQLQQLQAMTLSQKVVMTKQRIRQWVEHYGIDKVYVSFSGGKDSTVLLHIAREVYPDMKAVFVDTSLEFPEIREFVKKFDNVNIVRPKMNFRQVIEKYGYPMFSKETSEVVYGARRWLTELRRRTDNLANERTNECRNHTEQLTSLVLTADTMRHRGGAGCLNQKWQEKSTDVTGHREARKMPYSFEGGGESSDLPYP